jgi:hypothetical protein
MQFEALDQTESGSLSMDSAADLMLISSTKWREEAGYQSKLTQNPILIPPWLSPPIAMSWLSAGQPAKIELESAHPSFSGRSPPTPYLNVQPGGNAVSSYSQKSTSFADFSATRRRIDMKPVSIDWNQSLLYFNGISYDQDCRLVELFSVKVLNRISFFSRPVDRRGRSPPTPE